MFNWILHFSVLVLEESHKLEVGEMGWISLLVEVELSFLAGMELSSMVVDELDLVEEGEDFCSFFHM